MLRLFTVLMILAVTATFGCSNNLTDTKLESPSGNLAIEFQLNEQGVPIYSVTKDGKEIIKPSALGFDFNDQAPLNEDLVMIGGEKSTEKETWEMPWGEQREVVNHYNEMKVELEEQFSPNRKIDLYFRAYDDGVAFRYYFHEQNGQDTLTIADERTEFNLTGDHTTWWQPGDWDIYEQLYTESKFSEIEVDPYRSNPANLIATYIPENSVNTPVTMRMEDGTHLSFHEANLWDYAGMTLLVDTTNLSMKSSLVKSDRFGHAVKRALPFATPWRTIQITDNAGDLIESRLIVNLNEPNKLGDVSWFTPMKYMGIWWEMHLGIATWDYEQTQDMSTWNTDEATSVRHGATTENAKRYIDFASENGIKGLLIEGWNTGWDRWIGFPDREGVFDFVTPYPDYDIDEVVRYATERGVEIIMHHETSAAVRTYEQQMDTAYALMQKYGMHSVKTGYVGPIIPDGEYHHGQWMVNHYNYSTMKAAEYQVALNIHEPIKATGLRRTYPNLITREGLRGQEFNAWSLDGGNPPDHLPKVAFTRMLAGPIDFTPGIFNIKLDPYRDDNQVSTTLAQQLALYVVIYSPVQMAADLPENYEGQPAFQFIRDVGVDWEQSIVLNGEVGDFVTIAREERETGNWFVGGITNEEARELTIDFDFLDPNAEYDVVIYKDAADSHWDDNPTAIDIEEIEIDQSSSLTIQLAEGGGFAISLLKQ
jgi:glucan 1,4-alpha-glucosidase